MELAEARREKHRLIEAMREMLGRAEGRVFTRREEARYKTLEGALEGTLGTLRRLEAENDAEHERAGTLNLHPKTEEELMRLRGYGDGAARTEPAGRVPLLTLEQRVAPYFRSGLATLERYTPEGGDVRDVRLGALLAAFAHPAAADRLRDGEQRALVSGLTGPAGHYLVPEAVGALFIDAVRPLSRVLEAGARTFPMTAPEVRLPGWDEPLAAGWRSEAGTFPEASGTFKAVVLRAKSCAAILPVTIEELEDAVAGDLDTFASLLEVELGRAIAGEIDRALLFGTGTDSQPLGLYNTAGISTTEMATNGAVPTDWSKFLDMLAAVEQANFTPGALLYSARTKRTMAGLPTGISSDKTPLQRPQPIVEATHLVTNQIPNDLAWGSDTASSAAFAGQWDQLVLGVRPSLAVRIVTDPYSQVEQGKVRIAAYLRCDVGVLQPAAFGRLTGIKA
jgi:HK97 family phage major capsid protein